MPGRAAASGQNAAVPIRAVLFDFGNTLFAHAPLPEVIVAEAGRLGHLVTGEWVQALADRIHRAAHSPVELAHPRDLDPSVWAARWPVLYAAGDDRVPGLGAALYRSMHAPAEWLPYAATERTLMALHDAGVPVGVVSNTGWDVRTVFAHHGLSGCVDAFVLSCEVGAVKPSAAIFERACAALRAHPADTLMVGDDRAADAGAVGAGLTTLLLPALPPGVDNGLGAVVGLAIAT